jgi:hypothetical protein
VRRRAPKKAVPNGTAFLFILGNRDYFIASSTATAQATVIPTIGFFCLNQLARDHHNADVEKIYTMFFLVNLTRLDEYHLHNRSTIRLIK